MVACPCCGAETDIPILFKGLRQYIFAFIWNNPGCTSMEINDAVYLGEATLTTITGHIAGIRRVLRKTCYAVASRPRGPRISRGRVPYKYKIIQPRKEQNNGTTILPTILP